jgi:hypothetical protein
LFEDASLLMYRKFGWALGMPDLLYQ